MPDDEQQPDGITREQIESLYREQSRHDFLTFVDGLIIPSQSGPQTFADCMAEHQRECFEKIAPSLHALRAGEMPECRRYWWERTKKASKDGDIAIVLLWLMAFPLRPFYSQIAAADKDQAKIVKDRVESIIYYNDWLRDYVGYSDYKIWSTDGLATTDVEPADVGGSHGATPDLLIFNELSHVTKWEFAENMLSNAAGVPRGIVIVALNAGIKGTEAEEWRTNAIDSPLWSVHILDRPAPWTSPELLADEKKRLSTSRYNRLWWGKWSSGKGDAVSEESIDACFGYGLAQLDGPEAGWEYVAGLDMGEKRDHSGFVIVGVHGPQQLLRLAYMQSWQPDARSGEIDAVAVKDTVHRLIKHFRVAWCGYDPFQAVLLAQELRLLNCRMEEMRFVASNLDKMASTFIQVVDQKKFQAYDDEVGTLRRDFGKLYIVEKKYGQRLEATKDQYGHADVATALLICLPEAVRRLQSYRRQLTDDDVLVMYGDAKLGEKEVEEMHPELRAIYESYGQANGSRRSLRPRIDKADLDLGW